MPEKISQNKKERFKRLASSRTNEVIKRLKVLSNCGNRSAYEYDENDVNQIFSAVERAVKESRSKFHHPSKNSEFKLK